MDDATSSSSSSFRHLDYSYHCQYLDQQVVFDEMTTRTNLIPIEPGKSQTVCEPLPKFETFMMNPQIYESSSLSRPPDMDADTLPSLDPVQHKYDAYLLQQLPQPQAASTPAPVIRPTPVIRPSPVIRPTPTYPSHHCRFRQSAGTTPNCSCLGYPLMASSPAPFDRSIYSPFVTPNRTSTTLNSGGEETSSSTDSSVPAAPPNTPVTDWSGSGSEVPLRELSASNMGWSRRCGCPTCLRSPSAGQVFTGQVSSSHREWNPPTLTTPTVPFPVPRRRGEGDPALAGLPRVLKQVHNETERNRRARVKNACDAIRREVPGLIDKTNRATMLEVAVLYVRFVNHVLARICNRSDRQNNDGGAPCDAINLAGGEVNVNAAPFSGKQESMVTDDADD